MTNGASTGTGQDGTVENQPLRVMIVDDSSVVRGLLTRLLETQPDVEVVSSVSDGQMAVNALRRSPVDVVILDIEMPRMDGLTALPLLMEARPGIQVIVASTLTEKNAEISLKALERGAADYLTKPTSAHGLGSMEAFNRQLVEKVIALGYATRESGRPVKTVEMAPPRRIAPSPDYKPSSRPSDRQYRPSVRPGRPKVRVIERSTKEMDDARIFTRPEPKEIVLRAAGKTRPEIITIGSSTGGPQALFQVLRDIGPNPGVPILITQHMPPTFTKILAEHAARGSGLPCKEAEDGEPLERGQVYIAPGDYHMLVKVRNDRPTIAINQDPPVNFCRPAVDPMLRSVVELYGSRILNVILTGMGSDGMLGSQAVVDAGGTVIAQDELTSIVWGMPGAVATRGLCSAVLPIDQIGGHVRKFIMRNAA
ncbi:MAG: chemotaxis response regulator protein-glutamate methylesterase [Alphaproteobacteria bacterium]|nr:chemotaxis response regulator protein-glutamate methylesterase [Alphaproteobacteria bacterium]